MVDALSTSWPGLSRPSTSWMVRSLQARVGWAKALARRSTRMKGFCAPCPPSALMQHAPILVGRAHERPSGLERMCERLCPPYKRGALPRLRAPSPEPMRQDLPQHAPLDRLVGRGRVMPPESVTAHGLGCCHEPVHDSREI